MIYKETSWRENCLLSTFSVYKPSHLWLGNELLRVYFFSFSEKSCVPLPQKEWLQQTEVKLTQFKIILKRGFSFAWFSVVLDISGEFYVLYTRLNVFESLNISYEQNITFVFNYMNFFGIFSL